MEIVGIIPARYHSQRLPQKLLRLLLGKPLLQWTWERARQARCLDRLIIACDNVQVQRAACDFGAEVVMTSPEHSSGTDRIAEAVRDLDTKYVINIQADEPLIHPTTINVLGATIAGDNHPVMASIKTKLIDPDDRDNPNVVKVVVDKNDNALYFSRAPIPYRREADQEAIYYKHIGIYAYTKDFLYTFKNLPASQLEGAEKLEQLRALEAGYKIKVVTTQFDSHGVDTEDDFKKVERILIQNGHSSVIE
ncbi:MAG: 3-deoxy-manno-octulosonate cytidylyltransferase [Candidatus Omnitrophica bacterium]|nr:3-deoxy-manno-octulosonate cytidylyltransferase [Candidatus Omnitrophota bacterium]